MGLQEAAEGFEKELESGTESDTIDSQSEETSTESSDNSEAPASELTDLSSLEKFRFEGKDWTYDDLKNSYLMQSDYTRKTQALSDERKTFEETKKYYDNLGADLAAVRANPSIATQFKEIYPEEFHSYLDTILGQQAGRDNPQPGAAPQGLSPEAQQELAELRQQVSELTKSYGSDKEEQATQTLDSWFNEAATKYPQETEGLAKLQERLVADLAEKVPDGELNQGKIEELFKEAHEQLSSLVEESLSKRLDKQRDVNREGRDIGKGGATPGTAPKNPRTIQEAADFAMSDEAMWS